MNHTLRSITRKNYLPTPTLSSVCDEGNLVQNRFQKFPYLDKIDN